LIQLATKTAGMVFGGLFGRRVGKSGFGSSSTAEQVVEGLDLSGKVAVVTGKSSQALSSIVAQGTHLNRLFCALHLITAKDLAGSSAFGHPI
jgi:hypothetical protein